MGHHNKNLKANEKPWRKIDGASDDEKQERFNKSYVGASFEMKSSNVLAGWLCVLRKIFLVGGYEWFQNATSIKILPPLWIDVALLCIIMTKCLKTFLLLPSQKFLSDSTG